MPNLVSETAVTRLLPNICTDCVEETRGTFTWNCSVSSRSHEFTPKPFQQPAQGVIFSAQVEDVDAAYYEVLNRDISIELELRDESFGMRRFMVADPNGVLVNVFSFP